MIAIINVAARAAFIREFTMFYSVAINAVLRCISILAVVAVFIVMTTKDQVAVFIFECVVRIFAVFRLGKLERDARLGELELSKIFYKRHREIIAK
jgi:hypothetical protein